MSTSHIPRAMGVVADMLQTSIRARNSYTNTETTKASSRRKDRNDSAIDNTPIIDISAKSKWTEPDVNHLSPLQKKEELLPDDDVRQKVLPRVNSVTKEKKKKRGLRLDISNPLRSSDSKSTISVTSRPSSVKTLPIGMGDSVTATRSPRNQSEIRQRRDALRLHLPGLIRQLSDDDGFQGLKALPDTPEGTPHRLSFAPRPISKDIDSVLRLNREKFLQINDDGFSVPIEKPLVAPPIGYDTSLGNLSGTSSGSSYDSASQTWNMINDLMKSVDKETIRRSRASLLSQAQSGQNLGSPVKNSSPVKSKRTEKRHGWVATSASSGLDLKEVTKRARSNSLSEIPDEQDSNSLSFMRSDPPSSGKRTRPRTNTLTRRASCTSLYSVVIKPTRSTSHEAPDFFVPMEDMPSNIIRVLRDSLERSKDMTDTSVKAWLEAPATHKLDSRSDSTDTQSSRDETSCGVYIHADFYTMVQELRAATASLEDEEISFDRDSDYEY